MKIAVIGANGMVGSRVIAEALSQGLTVDGYSRSGSVPEGAGAFSLRLADTAAVIEVINSHDATVIAVGGRDDYEAVKKAHADLIAAAPTGRFLVVGGAGALNAGGGKRLYETDDFPGEYLIEAQTFSAVFDSYVAGASKLEWSIIAPAPEIAPGTRTGEYCQELDVPAGNFVSAEDFAVAIVDELQNPVHMNQRFTVASADEAAARA